MLTTSFVNGSTGDSALAALEACLVDRPEAVAATGVGVNGRNMPEHLLPALADGGRLYGQLNALRPAFIGRFVSRKLRTPIGLYRGDGLMGSIAMHDLDPVNILWDQSRIASRADATYEIPIMSPFRVRDLKLQFHRKVRQARGHLENLAIRGIVYKHGYEAMPAFANEMLNVSALAKTAWAPTFAPISANRFVGGKKCSNNIISPKSESPRLYESVAKFCRLDMTTRAEPDRGSRYFVSTSRRPKFQRK